MALSINNYIDIKSKIIEGSVGNRDFSGLVFTKDTMKASTGTSDPYATQKANYALGKAVSLTKDALLDCFDASSDIVSFATLYFGYNGGNHTPSVINVALVSSDAESGFGSAKAAYTTATKDFTNFGSLTFLGDFTLGTTSGNDIAGAAAANGASDALMIVACKYSDAESTKTALSGIKNVHVVVSTPASGATNYAAWMCMAWYASVDYTKTDASATIDYKQFGTVPEVTDDGVKSTVDGYNENYVGLVQVNGMELAFYQRGVNIDGVDTGVFRDRVWLEGEITAGWFNLNAGVTKVPANAMGCAMVKAMVVDVASRGVSNGTILLDKELTGTQIAAVRAYTNSDTAPDIVQAAGYYVDAKVFAETASNRYLCQYTLVYAKGDHIGKVSGTNYLV